MSAFLNRVVSWLVDLFEQLTHFPVTTPLVPFAANFVLCPQFSRKLTKWKIRHFPSILWAPRNLSFSALLLILSPPGNSSSSLFLLLSLETKPVCTIDSSSQRKLETNFHSVLPFLQTVTASFPGAHVCCLQIIHSHIIIQYTPTAGSLGLIFHLMHSATSFSRLPRSHFSLVLSLIVVSFQFCSCLCQGVTFALGRILS